MKTIKFLFVTIAIVSLSLISYAQKPFAGTITYEYSYEGEGITDADRAQAPSKDVLTILGNKVRFEQVMLVMSMTFIEDFDTGEMIILMDAMGNKQALKGPKSKLNEMMGGGLPDFSEYEFKFIDETKTIAGYRGKKVEVDVEGNLFEIYYTDEFSVPDGLNSVAIGFGKIKGIILEMITYEGDYITRRTAKEVSTKKPKAHLFKVPDDYEVQTVE